MYQMGISQSQAKQLLQLTFDTVLGLVYNIKLPGFNLYFGIWAVEIFYLFNCIDRGLRVSDAGMAAEVFLLRQLPQ